MKENGIYEEFRDACNRHGKNLSRVLTEIGCSTGTMGGWKAGQYPRLDIVMKIADHLNMSLDDLCYGFGKSRASFLTDEQREWLYIIDNIPTDRREMCKDFLRTHAMIPYKFKKETS